MRFWINVTDERLLGAGPREWKLMACAVCRLAWNLLCSQEREFLEEASARAMESTSFHLDRQLAGYRKIQSQSSNPSATWPLVSRALDGFDTNSIHGLMANVEMAIESLAVLNFASSRALIPIRALQDTFLPGLFHGEPWPELARQVAMDIEKGNWVIYGVLADVLEDGRILWLQNVARSLKYESVACLVNSLLPYPGNWIVDLLCGRRQQSG